MKLVITGTKRIDINRDTVFSLIDDTLNELGFDWKWDVKEVVSGRVGDVDIVGEQWAMFNSIPIRGFFNSRPSDTRIKKLAKYGNLFILIRKNKDKETMMLSNKLRDLKCEVAEVIV
jgi:hypothetical protein